MRKIRKYNSFDKTNESEMIKEDKQWYIDNGYISDPSIKTKEDLLNKIESEINPAWTAFVADQKLPMKNPKINIESSSRNTYIRLTTDEIDDLGVFVNVLSSCQFVFFSGRSIEWSEQDGEFLFRPIIWSTLNLAYEAIRGGSNGMEYQISEKQRGNVWYDILGGKFNNLEEQQAYEKQHDLK